MKHLMKKINWILQFSSPHLAPPLLLPCPKFLLTEAEKASSLGPSCIVLCEQGSSSKMLLLMAISSKKILVLGWAPPDKDVDEQDVVDGDQLQEDLSTWMGTT